MTNKTRKTKNKIFAIPTAEPAIPVNPNKPAINAIIKNVIDQLNIKSPFCLLFWIFVKTISACFPLLS